MLSYQANPEKYCTNSCTNPIPVDEQAVESSRSEDDMPTGSAGYLHDYLNLVWGPWLFENGVQ
jgi:hypothetical protein